jgi:hypothetical protein
MLGENDLVKLLNKYAANKDMPYCTGKTILALAGLNLV